MGLSKWGGPYPTPRAPWESPLPTANLALPATAPEAGPVPLVSPGAEFLRLSADHAALRHQAQGEARPGVWPGAVVTQFQEERGGLTPHPEARGVSGRRRRVHMPGNPLGGPAPRRAGWGPSGPPASSRL